MMVRLGPNGTGVRGAEHHCSVTAWGPDNKGYFCKFCGESYAPAEDLAAVSAR